MNTPPLRLGSLCSGYGGLDMAARTVLGGELAFVADPDPGAAKILKHHHPDVPNLRDIRAVDWGAVPPVDVLTAGFPCQDISNAGKRAGIEGERSGIWSNVVEAVGVLRPRIVFLENVGALTVRGLDTVLADLAEIGFDAEWTCLRASDVGAPHRRERWFLIAWPSDAHPTHLGYQRPRRARAGRDGSSDSGAPSAHPDRAGHARLQREPSGVDSHPKSRHDAERRREGAWGPYTGAIRRWEHATGRPAPVPTEPGQTGPRLSPQFVEWLMGLPAGHVTGVPGPTRAQQLRALGNGVVPQQGVRALRLLLEHATTPAPA